MQIEPFVALTTIAITQAVALQALRRVPARSLGTSAIVSAALVLPFLILELVNRRAYHEEFPFPLFGLLWLLTLSFIVVLMPIVRSLRAREKTTGNLLGFLLKILFLALVAWVWINIVLDQVPCFLGVLSCD